MFSRTVERVLNSAAREAVTRRHAHLTLEHLLFAIVNETSGDKILRAAGAKTDKIKADLDAFLDEHLETLPLGAKRPPEQTLAFRRVLQTAVLHVQSAGKAEADVGDILAALLAQGRSYAVDLLTGQGVSRLDILNYISHGISKVSGGDGEAEAAPGGGSLLERLPLRFGATVLNWPDLLPRAGASDVSGGVAHVDEWAVSLGTGVLTPDRGGSFDLSLEGGRRGNEDDLGARETFLRLTLSIQVSDETWK